MGKNFYPHNVLAESYVEQGILGFSLLAVLLLYPFIAFLRRTTIYVKPIYLFFVLGAGSYLLHMMKSGDISRLGLFLFLSGVVLAITDGLPTRKNLLKAPL